MNTLLFYYDTNTKKYSILEHNDERLYVLAELLLDKEALSYMQQELESPTQHKVTAGRFAFERHGHIMIIKFYHALEAITEPEEPLMIDIKQSELEALIEQWHALIQEMPHEILLTREADHFALRV